MEYGREQWEQERSTWRIVIILNLVRGVNTILEVLADHRSPVSRRSRTLSNASMSMHQSVTSRLANLWKIQGDLERRLGAAAREDRPDPNPSETPLSAFRPQQEFSVTSNTGWKKALGIKRRRSKSSIADFAKPPLPMEIFEEIAQHADDIVALWADPDVQNLLATRDIVLEDSAI